MIRISAQRALFGLLLSLLVLSPGILLTGCESLIAPSVNTELTTLRKGSYRIDPAHAALLFKVDHMGLSTYVGQFTDFDATLDFDPNNLTATTLDAVVKIASIDVNNASLEDTLKGGNWFNLKQYPEATFNTVAVEVLDDNSFLFTGNLTLLGITAPVTLRVRFNGGANNLLTGRYTLGFTATGTMRRSDFGMDKYLAIVGDEVALEVYAEFQRR